MAIKSPNSLKFFIEQCLLELQTSFKKIMLLSINKRKVVILQTYIEAVPQSKYNNDNASFLSDTTLCTDTHLRTKRKKSLPTSASIKFRALFWKGKTVQKFKNEHVQRGKPYISPCTAIVRTTRNSTAISLGGGTMSQSCIGADQHKT